MAVGCLHADSDLEERLIRAACYLVDVSWRSHPDYRTDACMEVVTRVNVSSAGHRGRAFIGACLLNLYKGGRKAMASEPAMALLTEAQLNRATQIGALMRLGCTVSGAIPKYLPQCAIAVEEGTLVMRPVAEARVFMGEEVEKRLTQAARAMGLDAKIG